MSSYKQLSGAQKRKLKNKRDAQIKSFKGSMDKYVSSVTVSAKEGDDYTKMQSDFESGTAEIINVESELNSPSVEEILLTMPISNCSSERSFSVLKRIKNRLRSSTKQDKLSSLSILSIESDLTAKLDLEDVINTFAASKSRKKAL